MEKFFWISVQEFCKTWYFTRNTTRKIILDNQPTTKCEDVVNSETTKSLSKSTPSTTSSNSILTNSTYPISPTPVSNSKIKETITSVAEKTYSASPTPTNSSYRSLNTGVSNESKPDSYEQNDNVYYTKFSQVEERNEKYGGRSPSRIRRSSNFNIVERSVFNISHNVVTI